LSVLAFLLAFHLAGPSDMIAFFDGKKVFQGGCEHTMDWVDLTLLKDHSAFMQSGMPRYAGRQYGTWSVKNDTVHIAIKTDSLLNSYNLIIKPGVGLFVVDHDKKNYNHNHSFFGDTKKLTKFFD